MILPILDAGMRFVRWIEPLDWSLEEVLPEGVMRVTLRDFRPHVRLFVETGYQGLANQITQDYLDSYASGLNQYVTELRRVTVASRETRLAFIQDIRSLNDAGITE